MTGHAVPGGVYHRKTPFYLDVSRADDFTKHNAAEYFKSVEQPFEPHSLAVLPNAKIAGQGAVITAGHHLVKQSVVEFTNSHRIPDGLLPAENGTYALPEKPIRRIDGASLLLKRPWYQNYGHWLVDNASVAAVFANVIGEQHLNLIVGNYYSSKMRDVVRDTLALICPQATIFEHPDDEIWEFETLYYAEPLHVPPLFMMPAGLEALRSAFLKDTVTATQKRRLFITRKTASSRKCLNEDELHEIAQKRGFELVEIEKNSVQEQAHLFAQAEAVISVKGAALTNGIFCMPRTKFMLLSPSDFPDPFFWNIVAQLDCDYGEIFGDIEGQNSRSMNDFRIAPEDFIKMLDAYAL